MITHLVGIIQLMKVKVVQKLVLKEFQEYEIIQIKRDLEILKYTGGKLFILHNCKEV